MKKLTPFLLLLFVSCTKYIDKVDTQTLHDTLWRLQVDTVHTFAMVRDTVIKLDTHVDTITQVKHDTLFITTTKTDTLFKSFLDTVYLTKTFRDTVVKQVVIQLHDTVSKYVYLHDTINNFEKVFIHDTVVKITTTVQHDTVYRYYENAFGYPVPAKDSGQLLYIYLDTVPGFILKSIEFQNIYTFHQTPGDYFQGIFSQDNTYTTLDVNPYTVNNPQVSYQLNIPGPMVCNIIITYDWTVETPVTFELDTFNPGPGIRSEWKTYSPGGLGGAPGTKFSNQAQFQSINMPRVFSMRITNHY